MDWKEKNIEQIDGFLRGQLPEKEIDQFQEKLQKNSDFAQTLHEIRRLKKGIKFHRLKNSFQSLRAYEYSLPEIIIDQKDLNSKDLFEATVGEAVKHGKRKELLGALKELEGDLDEVKIVSSEAKRRRLIFPLSIAAGVLLLISVGLFVFLPDTPKTGEELFLEYFEAYPSGMIKRSSSKSNDLTTGYVAYTIGDYVSAIEILSNQKDTISQFFLGISYLAVNQPNNAIKTLYSFKNKSKILPTQVDWYIALAYLKKGEREQAESILKSIMKLGNSYSKKAEMILKNEN